MNSAETTTASTGMIKSFFQKYFIDAFTGMALGLFVTLIAGLIISQIGGWLQIPALMAIGKLASVLMGAGIGVGIAYYLKAPTLVMLSCLVAGMLGAHTEAFMAGTLFTAQDAGPATFLALPGNPIGAYLASVFAYRAGTWVSGKTKLDILLVPLVVCTVAWAVCAFLNPPVVVAVNAVGQGIQAATELQPLLMGIVIAVIVGILLTLPTSSAAICIAIGLGGLGAVALGRHVTLAGVDRELHADLRALVERADHVVGVEDRDVTHRLDVARRDGARALLAHDHALGSVALHLDGDFLDVEDDVGDILAHAGDRGEFVQHAVDLYRGHRGAAQRRQEHATQRIAERQAEAALERLGDERRHRLVLGRELDLVRLDQFLPVFLDHAFVLPFPRHHPIVPGDLETTEERPAGARAVVDESRVRRGASCAAGIRCAGSASRRGSR